MDRVYCLHKNDSDPNHELYVKAKNLFFEKLSKYNLSFDDSKVTVFAKFFPSPDYKLAKLSNGEILPFKTSLPHLIYSPWHLGYKKDSIHKTVSFTTKHHLKNDLN